MAGRGCVGIWGAQGLCPTPGSTQDGQAAEGGGQAGQAWVPPGLCLETRPATRRFHSARAGWTGGALPPLADL